MPDSFGSSSRGEFGTGGDFESALALYMGAPNNPDLMHIDIHGKSPQVTHALPLAYHGKSLTMAMLVEKNVIDKDDFYTKKLLPWLKTDDLTLKWRVWKFDRSMAKPTPPRGNPEMIQSSTSEHRDSLVRHALGFSIDHEFWKTEDGHELYLRSLECLRDAVIFTCYYLIIRAILTKGNQHRNWQLTMRPAAKTIGDAINKTYSGWAVINKGAADFRKYVADLQEYFENKHIALNVLCLPPRSRAVLSTHSSELEYFSGGSHAERVNKEQYNAYNKILGLDVHETTIFTDEYSDDKQPLMRRREYGTFFQIVDWNESSRLEDYRSEERLAAKILDAKSDTEKLVRGVDLIPACGRFDSNGRLSGAHLSMIRPDHLSSLKADLKPDQGDKYIDMFVGYDHREKDGYFVMKYFGEMWEKDLRKVDVRKFCKTAEKNFRLSPADWVLFDKMEAFLDILNTVDENLPDHAVYLAALAHSGYAPDSENYDEGAIFAKNTFGSVWPPVFVEGKVRTNIGYRKKDGKTQKLYFNKKDKRTYVLGYTDNHKIEDWGEARRTVPLGFGNFPGLQTLAHMSITDDDRGYDRNILSEAHKYVELIGKLYAGFNLLFPGHMLLSPESCPVYHRTEDKIKDGLTAFFTNVCSHFRGTFFTRTPLLRKDYPIEDKEAVSTVYQKAGEEVFTLATLSGGKSLSGAAGPIDPELNEITDTTASNSIMGMIHSTLEEGKAFPGVDEELMKLRLQHIYSFTKSVETKEALKNKQFKKAVENSYKGKKYAPSTGRPPYTLGEFLTYLVIGDGVDTDEGEKRRTRVFSAAVEILTKRSVGQINWAQVINSASREPVTIRSVDAGPHDDGTEPDNSKWGSSQTQFINSRLTMNNSVFVNISVQEGEDAKLLQIMGRRIALPANPFNPTIPLGLNAALGEDADKFRKSKEELRYATSAMKRNGINSLTTSLAMTNHLQQNNATRKRSEPGERSAGAKFRRGGGDHRDYQRVEDTRRALLGSIFDGNRNEDNYNSYETIPTEIAISRALDLFSTTIEVDLGEREGIQGSGFRSTLIRRFHEWGFDAVPLHKMIAQCFITSEIREDYLYTWWDHNVWLPVGFQLFRIRQSYNMGSGFVAQGGNLLGRMCYGNVEMELGDDMIRKMHEGHLTLWLCATIRDPNRLMICPDILAMNYIGGESTSLIRSREDFEKLLTNPDEAPGDMLVKMIPGNRTNPEIRQDVSGRWNPYTVRKTRYEGIPDETPIHGESVFYYCHLYSLHTINNRRYDDIEAHFKEEGSGTVNTTVSLGHHRLWNAAAQSWSSFVKDQGPWGDDIFAGVVKMRSNQSSCIGEAPFKKDSSSNIIM